jgi:hypothetical protein
MADAVSGCLPHIIFFILAAWSVQSVSKVQNEQGIELYSRRVKRSR